MGDGGLTMARIAASLDIVSNGNVTFVATGAPALDDACLVPGPHLTRGNRSVGSDGEIEDSHYLSEASRSCGRGVDSEIFGAIECGDIASDVANLRSAL